MVCLRRTLSIPQDIVFHSLPSLEVVRHIVGYNDEIIDLKMLNADHVVVATNSEQVCVRACVRVCASSCRSLPISPLWWCTHGKMYCSRSRALSWCGKLAFASVRQMFMFKSCTHKCAANLGTRD